MNTIDEIMFAFSLKSNLIEQPISMFRNSPNVLVHLASVITSIYKFMLQKIKATGTVQQLVNITC